MVVDLFCIDQLGHEWGKFTFLTSSGALLLKVVLEPVALASPENFLEMQNLRTLLRPNDPEPEF